MFAITIGVCVAYFGVCLSGNFWNLAGRIFEFLSGVVNIGTATVNTFRLIGMGGILIGLFWIVTALSEIL